MPTEILISFLLEAIFVALIGGGLGIAIGYSVDGLTQSAKVGSHDLQVAFRVDSAILIAAIIFSLVMGILGGLLPAMSAMRIKPLEAFR
jgi:ABC-type antimicrobial peptide transport system permease subunit